MTYRLQDSRRVKPLKTASNAMRGRRIQCPYCRTPQVERLHTTLGREMLPAGQSWGHCRCCGRDMPIDTREWNARQEQEA